MKVFEMCPILAFLAILLTTPVLLIRILSRVDLRQQTRFLLLANLLFSDLLFVCMNILSACINLSGVLMTEWPCAVLLFLSTVLYSSGVLSITAMVLDTCFAVSCCHLGRLSLFPCGSCWHVFVVPYPLHVSMLLTVTSIIFILLLVLSGYLILYFYTRNSGVWKGQASSRAKGTFMIHYLHLFLAFCPLLVLVIELMLCYKSEALDLRASLWMSLVVCNVLLILPKALAPYLYGLRYRELCGVLFQFFRLNRPRTITPVL
ncbi:hypothetical protein PO909_031382 [Leuciscus waleckii]